MKRLYFFIGIALLSIYNLQAQENYFIGSDLEQKIKDAFVAEVKYNTSNIDAEIQKFTEDFSPILLDELRKEMLQSGDGEINTDDIQKKLDEMLSSRFFENKNAASLDYEILNEAGVKKVESTSIQDFLDKTEKLEENIKKYRSKKIDSELSFGFNNISNFTKARTSHNIYSGFSMSSNTYPYQVNASLGIDYSSQGQNFSQSATSMAASIDFHPLAYRNGVLKRNNAFKTVDPLALELYFHSNVANNSYLNLIYRVQVGTGVIGAWWGKNFQLNQDFTKKASPKFYNNKDGDMQTLREVSSMMGLVDTEILGDKSLSGSEAFLSAADIDYLKKDVLKNYEDYKNHLRKSKAYFRFGLLAGYNFEIEDRFAQDSIEIIDAGNTSKIVSGKVDNQEQLLRHTVSLRPTMQMRIKAFRFDVKPYVFLPLNNSDNLVNLIDPAIVDVTNYQAEYDEVLDKIENNQKLDFRVEVAASLGYVLDLKKSNSFTFKVQTRYHYVHDPFRAFITQANFSEDNKFQMVRAPNRFVSSNFSVGFSF